MADAKSIVLKRVPRLPADVFRNPPRVSPRSSISDVLQEALNKLGVSAQPFSDIGGYQNEIWRLFPQATEDKARVEQLQNLLDSVDRAESRDIDGVVACVQRIQSLSSR